MIILFWILIFVLLYSYLLYPLLVGFLAIIVGKNRKELHIPDEKDMPTITLLVTAYNEEAVVDAKIKNSLELKYPSEKLKLLWVTDGSDDDTPNKVSGYNEVTLMHSEERRGKIHAMNRAAQSVETEIIVFCDANTYLTEDTLLQIAKHFQNDKVGCVAGEKQIFKDGDTAAGAGEGLYWKYESWLKRLDYKFNTTLGAAGELFAVRRELYQPVESDTVLDDFIISLRIASKGYIVAYEPKAIAREYPSFSVSEEMKRKIRIAAGGFQSIGRLKKLLNPFNNARLTFQFVSHKIFRWLVCPLALLLLIPIHAMVIYFNPEIPLYAYLGIAHAFIYVLAVFGWLFEKSKLNLSFIYLPYYFIITNIAQLQGFMRYLKKSQSVNWERARRAR
ncbi:MAG: glycosyl transferase [Salinivirgaceae bacterium]|nr:MAG: glycosyl transferase [Salinivirgaceae bacterium]